MSSVPVSPNSEIKRGEDRTPLNVLVDLASVDVRVPAQECMTVNVSARGAQVLAFAGQLPVKGEGCLLRSDGEQSIRGRPPIFCRGGSVAFPDLNLPVSAAASLQ